MKNILLRLSVLVVMLATLNLIYLIYPYVAWLIVCSICGWQLGSWARSLAGRWFPIRKIES